MIRLFLFICTLLLITVQSVEYGVPFRVTEPVTYNMSTYVDIPEVNDVAFTVSFDMVAIERNPYINDTYLDHAFSLTMYVTRDDTNISTFTQSSFYSPVIISDLVCGLNQGSNITTDVCLFYQMQIQEDTVHVELGGTFLIDDVSNEIPFDYVFIYDFSCIKLPCEECMASLNCGQNSNGVCMIDDDVDDYTYECPYKLIDYHYYYHDLSEIMSNQTKSVIEVLLLSYMADNNPDYNDIHIDAYTSITFVMNGEIFPDTLTGNWDSISAVSFSGYTGFEDTEVVPFLNIKRDLYDQVTIHYDTRICDVMFCSGKDPIYVLDMYNVYAGCNENEPDNCFHCQNNTYLPANSCGWNKVDQICIPLTNYTVYNNITEPVNMCKEPHDGGGDNETEPWVYVLICACVFMVFLVSFCGYKKYGPKPEEEVLSYSQIN